MSHRVAAVDLGASSGRVYAVEVADEVITLEEVGRFPNGGVRLAGTLYWDLLGIYRGVLEGLAVAGRQGPVASIGIDSWAVDYGLVRGDGTLLSNPIHYRDARSQAPFDEIVARVGADDLYRRSGIALHRFNTLFQLAADARSGLLDQADRILLIPDLLGFFLTGRAGAEVTNASTTQLLGVDGQWDSGLAQLAGVPPSLLPPLIQPGERIGALRPAVAAEIGLGGDVPVTAVASHDTASAVVGVPALRSGFAYISCGTWSLVGIEVDAPRLGADAARSGFTNERGIDGTVRFLRNVMGLWLLQECVRAWTEDGPIDFERLHAAAGGLPALRSVIDPDRPELLEPGDMPARIAAACRRAGQPEPTGPAELVRCIIDSLGVAYRRALQTAEILGGQSVEVVHLVGGGVNNHLLCQVTADACGLPVIAGPVEAAAIGNAVVQARALGVISGDRFALRALVAANCRLEHYEPDRRATLRFAEAASRLGEGRIAAG